MDDMILELTIGSLIITIFGYISWSFKRTNERQAEDIRDLMERARHSETELELVKAEKVDREETRRIFSEMIQPLARSVDETRDTSKDVLHELHKLSISFAKKFPDS